jgi:PAS domain S-box-containing protein
MRRGGGTARELAALRAELERLRAERDEAAETLRAIREGEVDAIVVSGSEGDQVFSLAGSESVYRLIVETMKEAALTVTTDGRILFCNGQFSAFVQTAPEQILGHPLTQFVASEQRALVASLLAKSREASVKQRLVFQGPGGSPVPAHISATALCQADSLSVCIVATDLTELEASTDLLRLLRTEQAALRASEEEFRAFFNTVAVGATQLDLDGRFVRVNDRFCEITGFSREELIGMTPADLAPPEDRAVDQAQVAAQLQNPDTIFDVETRYVRKDGRVIWVHVTGAPIRDAAGRPLRSTGIIQDITERKEAEEALRQSRGTLQAVLDAAPAGIVVAHVDGRILLANAATDSIFGDPVTGDAHGPAGGYTLRNTDGTAVPAGQLFFPRALEGYMVTDTEFLITRADGTQGFIVASATPLRHDGGTPWAAVMVLQDITHRKWTEQALQKAKDELEERVQARTSELSVALQTLERQADQLHALAAELTRTEQRERRRLAGLLHDGLQQVLVAARLQATMLGQSQDPTVRQGGDQIVALLEEALKESRTLTGELSPPILRRGDVRAALEWLSHWMAEKHQLTVRVHPPATPTPVLSEDMAGLVYEAVRELLFNTAKHAQVRAADVTLAHRADTLQITVADTGSGFDPSLLRVTGGTEGGFGLLSVRERLEFSGGRLDIVSAPGQGSRFTLYVPVPAAPAALPAERPVSPPPPELRPARPAFATRKLRVLVADDHAVVRQGFVRLMRAEPDLEVVGEAADGKAAVELACRLRPDVVVMDVNMPVLDGIEATRQIRALCPEARVVGLSVFADEAHAQAMRDAGAAAYLPKSGSSDELLAAIRGEP